mgnify:CR=1 FL=1
MLSNLEKWTPHKKWLAAVALFLSTSFIPNDIGILALFCTAPPLGFYTAEMLMKEDFSFVQK